MVPFDTWVIVWVVEVGTCCLIAAWKGGPIERIGATIILIGWIFSVLLESRAGNGPGIGVALVDIATLIAFSVLSADSRRLWTLFAVACQLNGVAAHLAEYFTQFGLYSYITALGIWSGDGLVVCVLIGVIDHNRRQKRLARMAAACVQLPPPYFR